MYLRVISIYSVAGINRTEQTVHYFNPSANVTRHRIQLKLNSYKAEILHPTHRIPAIKNLRIYFVLCK